MVSISIPNYLPCVYEDSLQARKRLLSVDHRNSRDTAITMSKAVDLAQHIIAAGQEDAFVVMDTSVAADQYDRWVLNMPRVSPWYAIKCQPDLRLMKTLFDKGCGFDAASIAEMKAALSLGCPPERIIFANPCKTPSHIKFAYSVGIRMMTFDNIEELHKIKQHHPTAQVVMRILGDDSSSVCKFNAKFGVGVTECGSLIREAKRIGCDIVGVSFHVGSGCQSADAFVGAVENARKAFDLLIDAGFSPRLLDLGGGWPGSLESDPAANEISFEEITTKLRPALDELFPDDSVAIIAEPGRYFAHACCIAVAGVTSKRVLYDEVPLLEVVSGDDETDHDTDHEEVSKVISGFRYYINDGVYGTFNAVICDHRDNVVPAVFLDDKGAVQNFHKSEHYSSSIWGNTCDGLDKIASDAALPNVDVGSWFVFNNMGAYTTSAASAGFNGFDAIRKFYVE